MHVLTLDPIRAALIGHLDTIRILAVDEPTEIRGCITIAAAASRPADGSRLGDYVWARDGERDQMFRLTERKDSVGVLGYQRYGAIIGTAELEACLPIIGHRPWPRSDLIAVTWTGYAWRWNWSPESFDADVHTMTQDVQDQRPYSELAVGRHALAFRNFEPFDKPLPWDGVTIHTFQEIDLP